MFYVGSITGLSGAIGPSGPAVLVLPPGTKSVYLQGSASGIQWSMGVASGSWKGATNPPNLSGYAPGPGSTVNLDGPGLVSGPFRVIHNPNVSATVVGIYNPGLGTVSVAVFASPTS
jgi:hypothetical protein